MYPSAKINEVILQMMTAESATRQSVINITKNEELSSLVLGAQGNLNCGTCYNNWNNCRGHFGTIQLPQEFLHPLFSKYVVMILNMVCSCGTLRASRGVIESLVDDDKRPVMSFKGLRRVRKLNLHKNKFKDCPYSNQDRIREDIRQNIRPCTQNPTFEHNKASIDLHYQHESQRIKMSLTPAKAYAILSRISNESAELLGFDTSRNQHPRNLIITKIIVIPYYARGSTNTGKPQQQDDLSSILQQLLSNLRKYDTQVGDADKMLSLKRIYENIIVYMHNDIDMRKNNVAYKDIWSMITGKDGAARAVSQGKRVNFVGRTVAAPGPYLPVDVLSVPRVMADQLTRTITAHPWNLDSLRQDYQLGHVKSIQIIRDDGTFTIDYKTDKPTFKRHYPNYIIKLGDKVTRALKTGDLGYFNRNPTLHTGNFPYMKVVINENENVLRCNLPVTGPMNLDFDGDETQIHVIQTPEGYADAAQGASVRSLLIDYNTGKTMIGPTFDAVTGMYLLSREDIKVPEFLQRKYINQELHNRLQFYNIEPTDSRALISSVFPPGFYYNKNGIQVQNGVFITGTLTKKIIGTGYGGFIIELIKQYPTRNEVMDYINKVTFLVNDWFNYRGMTIDLSDCVLEFTPAQSEEMTDIFMTTRDYIMNLTKANFGRKLNPDQLAVQENTILDKIANVRGAQDRIITDILKTHGKNNAMDMISSGSKGTIFNMTLMTGSLTQQLVLGQRLPISFPGGRVWCTTQPNVTPVGEQPESRGYCKNSFGNGLTATELFSHMCSTRESLIKSSKATAKTGDIQRLIVKSCEDVVVDMEGAVSITGTALVQPIYGGTGLDPRNSEKNGVIRIPRDFVHVAKVISDKWRYL